MKFNVFYLQFINSLEGLGMFFSSAAFIRRLRRYTATTAHQLLFQNVIKQSRAFWSGYSLHGTCQLARLKLWSLKTMTCVFPLDVKKTFTKSICRNFSNLLDLSDCIIELLWQSEFSIFGHTLDVFFVQVCKLDRRNSSRNRRTD